MSIPKRKNDIKIYKQKELTGRREELLDKIIENDTFLPEPLLHDDLDKGMLEYVLNHFKITSNGEYIPIIPKILTIQRWSEISNTWEYTDKDRNIKIPFISIVRRPEVQPGTNPSTIRTIPERKNFYYHSVPTWNGNKKGFDIYKIPQPIAVDITYEVTIVTTEIRDLNKFNQIVLERFASKQSYAEIKGHYIPIILDRISDSSNINNLDVRRFYVQTYSFIMLGLIVDEEEFEVAPGIDRTILLSEIIGEKQTQKTELNKSIDIHKIILTANGDTIKFSTGEKISELLLVTINGLVQEENINFYHIPGTSNISFIKPPIKGSIINVLYIGSYQNNILIDENLNQCFIGTETFTFKLTNDFKLNNIITNNDVIYLSVNGLVDEINYGYTIFEDVLTLNFDPLVGSTIEIRYIYKTNYNDLPDRLLNKNSKFFTYFINNESFICDGSTLIYEVEKPIKKILHLSINGIIDNEKFEYTFKDNIVTLDSVPLIDSKILITYAY